MIYCGKFGGEMPRQIITGGRNNVQMPVRSLKGKVTRLVGILTLLFLIAYLAIFYLYHQPKLLEQEEMFARKTVMQVQGVLDRTLHDLVSLNEDWSNWDAMYRAVNDWTPQFEAEAFPQEVFESLNIDYVGVFNEAHDPVFSVYLVQAPDGPVLVKQVPHKQTLNALFQRDDHLVTGMFPSEGSPLFISSQPIVRSDGSGPERGFLVMGRGIRQPLIDAIGETVRERVWLIPVEEIDPEKTLTIHRTGLELVLEFPVQDYFHRNLFGLRVVLERSLFEVLYHSTLVSMGLLLVAVLTLIIVLSTGVESIVLRRIMETAEAVSGANVGKLGFNPVPEKGNDEITLLQRSFNRLLARIDREEQLRRSMEEEIREIERLATAGRVTGNILHEINNPIRVIKNCLFAIEQQPEKLPETLHLLRSEVRQLGNLTNQLLDFTGGRDNLEMETMNLVSVIRETVLSISTAFPEGEYSIVAPESGLQAIVFGDADRLKQVFFNILKNGLEAMAFSGRIMIDIAQDTEPGMLAITIRDEGPGVESDAIPHLFEPFYTRHKESGVGLGLSISYDIMKRHGGDIRLDETVRSGACFRIRIPGELEGDSVEDESMCPGRR